jgi:hypothetical protein
VTATTLPVMTGPRMAAGLRREHLNVTISATSRACS